MESRIIRIVRIYTDFLPLSGVPANKLPAAWFHLYSIIFATSCTTLWNRGFDFDFEFEFEFEFGFSLHDNMESRIVRIVRIYTDFCLCWRPANKLPAAWFHLYSIIFSTSVRHYGIADLILNLGLSLSLGFPYTTSWNHGFYGLYGFTRIFIHTPIFSDTPSSLHTTISRQ